ncbi:serum amyloid A-3 protein [Trichonephila clavipes]|uniref:Serum amyloid A-3 protein n=1 Tax=Trichonephila clavipes TaxID=2585209 RepID=A0A8X6R4D2_TRICX|nr:serum amyloid A-3 protein [Trichonephila clavipes]
MGQLVSKLDSEDGSKKRKTMKEANDDVLDRALYLWFSQRSKGDSISDPLLSEKAMELNEKLGGSVDFIVSPVSGFIYCMDHTRFSIIRTITYPKNVRFQLIRVFSTLLCVDTTELNMTSSVSIFCLITCLLLVNSPVCHLWDCDFVKEAAQGAADMWDAYTDMREANYIGADKYFHARGNYEAAERGPGGKWAAEVISDVREAFQGSDTADSKADQAANEWGRNGGDPNKYRQEGLPDNY